MAALMGRQRRGFTAAAVLAWFFRAGFISVVCAGVSAGVSAAEMPVDAQVASSAVAAMQAQTVALEQSAAGFAAFSVPDLAASTRWYQRQFGLTAQFRYQADDRTVALVVLSAPGLTVELQQHSAAQAPKLPQSKAYLQHGIFKVGIQVQDLQQALQVLQASGTRVEVPAFTDQNGQFHSAIIRDNSGNLLQLFQPMRTKP